MSPLNFKLNVYLESQILVKHNDLFIVQIYWVIFSKLLTPKISEAIRNFYILQQLIFWPKNYIPKFSLLRRGVMALFFKMGMGANDTSLKRDFDSLCSSFLFWIMVHWSFQISLKHFPKNTKMNSVLHKNLLNL